MEKQGMLGLGNWLYKKTRIVIKNNNMLKTDNAKKCIIDI